MYSLLYIDLSLYVYSYLFYIYE
ncbi:hypothetical protein KLEB273_gp263 [Bacillus phage vB_BauM_KLEB27-3]|nr:hypothetical protein KLEB273_gp263 [Bacillus phage vB_BauM_KLEB27-3]